MANGNGYAPDDANEFFSSLSRGNNFDISTGLRHFPLEFTSANSVELDVNGDVSTGSYTYEKTGPNAADARINPG